MFSLCDNHKDTAQGFNHKDVVSKWHLPKLVGVSHLSS